MMPARPIVPGILACHDCGLIQLVPGFPAGTAVACRRCDADIRKPLDWGIANNLALSLAGLVLMLVALFRPLFVVRLYGQTSSDLIQTGITALLTPEIWPLALLVATFTLIAPLVWFGLLIFVFSSILNDRPSRLLGAAFRVAQTLELWAMPDVLIVAAVVAYRRLNSLVMVDFGPGGWCLTLAAAIAFLLRLTINPRQIWSAIRPECAASEGRLESVAGCRQCGLVMNSARLGRCPRCGARLRPSGIAAPQTTAALIIAAYALYIPANVLPVMRVVHLGWSQTNTITAGIRDLYDWGMWPLAVIIFIASIAIPLLKLFGLTWLLVATRRRSRAALRTRTALYRVIDQIGRWSNIDIFVISILVALLHFGSVASVRAEPGAVAFAAVVVLTMLASRAFDPMLMWQAAHTQAHERV